MRLVFLLSPWFHFEIWSRSRRGDLTQTKLVALNGRRDHISRSSVCVGFLLPRYFGLSTDFVRPYNYYLALISFSEFKSIHHSLLMLWPQPVAILYYDYFLTISWEVERVWKTSGLNWATGLFYFNRYLCLLGHIPVIIEYFWSTSSQRKHDVSHSCADDMLLLIGFMLVLDVSARPVVKPWLVLLSLYSVAMICKPFISISLLWSKLQWHVSRRSLIIVLEPS